MKFSTIIALMAAVVPVVSATDYACKNQANVKTDPAAPTPTDAEVQAGLLLMQKTYKQVDDYDLLGVDFDHFGAGITTTADDSASSLDDEEIEEALISAGLRGAETENNLTGRRSWGWWSIDHYRCRFCEPITDDWPYDDDSTKNDKKVSTISLTEKSGKEVTYELQNANKKWAKKWCKALRKSGIKAFASASNCDIHFGACSPEEETDHGFTYTLTENSQSE